MTLVWALKKINFSLKSLRVFARKKRHAAEVERPGLGRFRDEIGKGPQWKAAVLVTAHSLRYQG